MKRLLLALSFIFLLSTPTYALNIIKTNTIPNNIIYQEYTTKSIIDLNEISCSKDALSEYIYYSKQFPRLNKLNLRIYILTQRFYLDNQIYAGYANSNNILLFPFPNNTFTNYVVAHELSHVIRFNYINKAKLDYYYRYRTKSKKPTGYFAKPDELFAEDFRWLFGSKKANKVDYRPNIPKPNKYTRKLILSLIKCKGVSN